MLYTHHPWAKSVATDGSCTLTIELLNTNTFWTVAMEEKRKDWQVRMTVADPTAADASITDYWTVSVGHECSTNVLALTTPTTDRPNFVIKTSGNGVAT